MTKNGDLKKLWQEEAKQLKDDLKKRSKEIQYREKQIKVGRPQDKNKAKIHETTPEISNKQNDNFLRQQLGI